MIANLMAAAKRVADKPRELEQRLRELHDAHPLKKLERAPIVVAAIYELLDHQATFNDEVIAMLSDHERTLSAIAPRITPPRGII